MIPVDILINHIPEDVIRYIGTFIPLKTQLFLSRECYEKNQQFLWEKCYKEYDNNIRKIIRKDYDYIFLYKLELNYFRWRKVKKWVYKNNIFKTFNDYLRYLCIEYNSSKCKKKLTDYEKKNGTFRKNKFKNIRSIRTRWSN